MNSPMLKPQLGQIEAASSNPISVALTPCLLKPTPLDVHKLIGERSFAKSMTSEEILNAFAHCDGPCGVYDPASARIAGEAVQSMTKKMLDLTYPDDSGAMAAYINTMSRYATIKEEEAQKCKDELLVLWTDFFKPQHLESIPNLHDTFWKAAKLCSACKVEVSAVHAQELMDAIEAIHHMFWTAKGRDDAWVRAS